MLEPHKPNTNNKLQKLYIRRQAVKSKIQHFQIKNKNLAFLANF